jgi:hypothetical protein
MGESNGESADEESSGRVSVGFREEITVRYGSLQHDYKIVFGFHQRNPNGKARN